MKKRLIEFIAYLKIGQLKFEENTGLSRGYVNKVGDNITLKSLDKIIKAYPELNVNWLKTGEGSMLKGSTPKVEEGASVPYFMYENLLNENKRLQRQVGYYEGLLEKNGIDYSQTVMSS